MYTTISQLESYSACGSGMRKLLRGLPPGYNHGAPIKLSHILNTNGVMDALWSVLAVDDYSPEHYAKVRKLAVAIMRLKEGLTPKMVEFLEFANTYDEELAKDQGHYSKLKAAHSEAHARYMDAEHGSEAEGLWDAIANILKRCPTMAPYEAACAIENGLCLPDDKHHDAVVQLFKDFCKEF
jgi:hypothetical protein